MPRGKVCGTSQAINDWYDRHVDAINEPHRPIPSGRIPGEWGFWIAVIWLVIRAWHRRSERCTAIGPMGYSTGWETSDRYDSRNTSSSRRSGRDERQEYIESLESRLSELEERLDFTERLLAGRSEVSGRA